MAQTERVVIFGGAGFIGQHLVSAISGEVAHIVVVGKRRSSGAEEVEYAAGDVTDFERVSELVRGADVVYQLTLESDYRAGAKNVAQACVEHGVRRLIYASTSDALYLGRRGSIVESEGCDPHAELRNDYSKGKGAAEQILLKFHKEQGLDVVIIRPCLVVGPGGRLAHGGVGRWVSPTACFAWGKGDTPMPFVLVGDVAQAMYLAMDAAGVSGQAFNLGGDVFLSARQFVELLATHTKRNFRLRVQNLVWLSMLFQLKQSARKLLRRAPGQGDSYYEMKSASMRTQIDNSLAKSLLGWRPNGSLEVFKREAIYANIESFLEGDLRLQAEGAS